MVKSIALGEQEGQTRVKSLFRNRIAFLQPDVCKRPLSSKKILLIRPALDFEMAGCLDSRANRERDRESLLPCKYYEHRAYLTFPKPLGVEINEMLNLTCNQSILSAKTFWYQ